MANLSKQEHKPNALQQECIDSINGIYMVLAGPGTGKTFTIINRLKNMIKNNNINPEEILCLTYTDAAASEMRSRLENELDNQISSGVNICTYHGFCCDIIEENKSEFTLPNNFKIVSDAISRSFVKDCIDEINPVYWRTDKNDPYFYIYNIKDSIDAIKSNRLTKESYFYNIEHNPDWKPLLSEKQKLLEEKHNAGNFRTKILESEIQSLETKINKAKELWTFYEKYQEKMTLNNYLDFNDMISFVLDKFEEDTLFLSRIANKYKYILVDEYQDTNKSQNTIVFSLAKTMEEQNVFVVGDDDQIIYSFQGAKLDTMDKFLIEFPETKVICLKENMRSTQSILDIARLISKQDTLRLEGNPNFQKYNISKELIAKNQDIIAKDKPVKFVEYNNEEQEFNAIVEEIEKLINSNDCPVDKDGNKKLSEIAVLTTANKTLEIFKEMLKAKNIPCELKNGENVFSIHAVNLLLAYMQVLTRPETYSDKMFQILLSKPFSINAKDYHKIYMSLSKYKTTIECLKSILDDKDLIEPEKIKNFVDTYEYLDEYKNGEKIKNIVLEIGTKTGIFNYFLNSETNRVDNIAGLKKIVEEANAFGEIFNSALLEEFVEYLNILINDEIPLLTDKAPVSYNAVQLSTYHNSKGREFEYVYLPNLINTNWESSRLNTIDIPLNPEEYKTDDEKKEIKISDKLKVLFVGMTRAKHSLNLSYSIAKVGSRKKLSSFISNILDRLEKEKAPEFDETSYWNEASKILEKRDYDYKKDFKEMIDAKLENMAFSPTSLNKYLSCPRQYFYEKILKFETKSGNPDNSSYGTAVHSACEFALNYAKEKGYYPEKEEFIEAFKTSLEDLPMSNYHNRINIEERGVKALEVFYNQLIITPIKNLDSAEKKIELELDGYKFILYIDKVERNLDGTYSLYDYKTGNPKTLKEVCVDGKYESYYNQLAFYKYMFEKETGKQVSKTEFIFPEKCDKNLEVQYTSEECKQVVEKYKNCIDKIKNLEFEPTYKKEACEYCSYTEFCNRNIL